MTPFLFSLAITTTILLPVGLAAWLRRRYPAPWWLFCLGMATFVGSQVYHLPLNNWLSDLGVIGEAAIDAPDFWRTAVILGLSAGLSETIARAVGYWLLWRRRPGSRRSDGIMVGLGHGGIEAIILGGVFTAGTAAALWSLREADLSPLEMTPAQITAVQFQLDVLLSSPWHAFAPLAERIIAMIVHVVLSLLVWEAFARRNVGYALLAAAYHALFDALAVIAPQFTHNVALMEGALLATAVPGLVWLWRTWPPRASHHTPPPLAHEWRLFVVALRKELLQQWRTKRVLAIVVVFLLFGFASPLTAKFTPQLLSMIEGADQFADLIPEPSRADALDQYIRNITQFGFIIAVLAGMGAVAGEKERGTAAILLSKPLPRWAFVLSKFTAQALVYAAALALAGLAAHYYTLLLFKPFDFVAFMGGNGVLWLWLLVFTAVTLLGSTLANSTGMGAGIALGGAAALLLLGNVPQIAGLTPGALAAWAGQLGITPTPFKAGALAANGALILILLVTAVAVFEEQEL